MTTQFWLWGGFTLFILALLALMERFHWTLYVFGTFLLVTGVMMMRKKEAVYDPEKNWVIRTFRRFFPVTDRYDGNRFFTRKDGRLCATPLFIVLLAVESSDIIFAMLGLRALYFAVAGFMQMFHFLHYGFASIIIILGTKMLLSDVYKLPLGISVTLIVVILLLCVIVSLLRPRRVDLKMMFQRSESLGLIPFRRLLLIENIIDMGDLKVRDAMRRCGGVRTVQLALPWEENLKVISDTHYSRYPVMTPAKVWPFRMAGSTNSTNRC